jgi:dsRNA-specific ribonuclease
MNNIISYPFIDYVIKSHLPDLLKKNKPVKMDLFIQAMTHHSVSSRNYDRLEYLGDGFFRLVIGDYLYERYDDQDEGFLTRLRIKIERGDSMVDLCIKLGLHNFIQSNEIIDDAVIEDVFEAFIGAFLLCYGIFYTRQLIINLIEKYKDFAELIKNDDNYKDLLLRYFHQVRWGNPTYQSRVDRRHFICKVINIDGDVIGSSSTETTKPDAEQSASKDALIRLGVIVNGEIDDDWISKLEIQPTIKNKLLAKRKVTVIQNPHNELLNKTAVKQLLKTYGVKIPKEVTYDIETFHEAMTHRSYLKRKRKDKLKLTKLDKEIIKESVPLQKKSYDRLKFVGNGVIHYVIGYFLYCQYDDKDEGFLTRVRCRMENLESLYTLGSKSGIKNYVLISQVIEELYGRKNVNIISSCFASFIGALYRELGFQIAKQYTIEVLRNELDIEDLAENETNYKDLVIFYYKKHDWGKPIYKLLSTEGPDHSKIFTIGLYNGRQLLGKGTASSKKKAEQLASKEMLSKIKSQ